MMDCRVKPGNDTQPYPAAATLGFDGATFTASLP
jgi:hypothetical protein